uniref:Uncharacterized protein n=1 Tax=Caenorhabditis japonica TaxID=281687 RepID=A0A8R1HMR6_CAEJA
MALPVVIMIVLAVALTSTIVFYTNSDYVPRITMTNGLFSIHKEDNSSVFFNVDSSSNYMDVCALPVYDVWHPSIKKFVKPYSPVKNCDKKREPITELKNGEWKILQKGANCSARCYKEDGYKNVKKGEWMKPGRVDCETLEAVCWEKQKEVYGYLHNQVLKKSINSTTIYKNPPNVFVFLVDSLSRGAAKRSLPKTLQFLSNTLKSVEFPFINKVGENSQPNAFALWFGKQVEKAKQIGGRELPVDWNTKQFCDRHLDNETHIFRDFANYGYVTMHAEDWSKQVIDSWPFCKGFKNSPVHHSMRPFQLAYEDKVSSIVKGSLEGKQCRLRDHAIFEYFQQWLTVYKDQPKFSWLWLNEPVHSNFNGATWYDDFYLEFFQKNQELFSNSFVFFMADHGFRVGNGDLFKSSIGNLEKSNPYLAISVPNEIRTKNPQILEILRKNAKSLQTHYDTRATFLDVLKYQPLSAFSDRKRINTPTEKGSSYLREQPEFPRTCGTLPIPQQYCICQVKTTNVNDPFLQATQGKRLINHINELIEKGNLTDICMKYEFKEVSEMKSLGVTNSTSTSYHMYKISVKVHGSPAHFDTLLMHNEKTDSVEFEKVTRLDTYGHSADCTGDRGFQKLCYCKVQQLLTTTTTTTKAPK